MVNQSWESEHLQDHPLVGKIWDAKTGQFSDPTDLIVHMQSQTFVLLGEKHDNADHHRIQAWITGQLFENKRKMAVAFEMFTLDKAEILEKFQASNPKSAAEIAEVTDWASSGWPDWEMYQPIAQLALDNGVPILATNMTRTQAMGMARENKTFLDAGALKRLRLDRPFPDALIDVKTKELIRSHCNMMPEHMIEPMLMAQTTKDAMMADVMIKAEDTDGLGGAILITGAGHGRTDWAIPWHIAQRAPDKTVLSLAMIEVDEDFPTVQDYSEEYDVSALPFDYLWFTPRTDTDDPCDKYAEQLKHMGKVE